MIAFGWFILFGLIVGGFAAALLGLAFAVGSTDPLIQLTGLGVFIGGIAVGGGCLYASVVYAWRRVRHRES
jgi:hypothetical protein